MYKTQMFVFHEGDHHRTRLTHTLEVAQIARTVARQLCLDEDLAEVLALAHDLGHPPFGHAGERILDEALAPTGGFDHNVQSFRLVTKLEARYADFDGLNLTWETLEGLIKHNGPPAMLARPDDARVVRALDGFRASMDLQLERFASAEAQVAAIADDIAWHTHDIDDGLRAGLIEPSDLGDVKLLRDVLGHLEKRPLRDHSRDIYELVRVLITRLVTDVVVEGRKRLRLLGPEHPDDIRGADHSVVQFSPAMFAELKELRTFLFERLYHHERVLSVMGNAQQIVMELFEAYASGNAEMAEPLGRSGGKLELNTGGMADDDTEGNPVQSAAGLPGLRLVGDYVAGMTDRFAIEQHRRLFDHTPELG